MITFIVVVAFVCAVLVAFALIIALWPLIELLLKGLFYLACAAIVLWSMAGRPSIGTFGG